MESSSDDIGDLLADLSDTIDPSLLTWFTNRYRKKLQDPDELIWDVEYRDFIRNIPYFLRRFAYFTNVEKLKELGINDKEQLLDNADRIFKDIQQYLYDVAIIWGDLGPRSNHRNLTNKEKQIVLNNPIMDERYRKFLNTIPYSFYKKWDDNTI